jgi:tetratricopeptide (TPR) repeat protein
MTGNNRPSDLPPSHHQEIRVESGFAYGVIGADIHVFGDGIPLYVLEEWRPSTQADATWLRELPSRMLNGRYEVVAFTGRDQELDQLRQWRQGGPRLAARWLHGPGGQGKTRLANQFAAESQAADWKVVTATHGPGTALSQPGSQDLCLHGAAGLLVIIDYADRWPLTHLTWLFSNALLHDVGTPTRVLMLARTADAWPAVRATLANHQAGTSSQLLTPLLDGPEGSGQRGDMFAAARDSFAALYGIANSEAIDPPSGRNDPDRGLTLAIHMAALVAVDAHVTDSRPPASMAGLTVYLLDREQLHWARRYGDGTHELDPTDRTYHTPPDAMNQAVFAAALAGPVEPSTGKAIVDILHSDTPPEQILADHAVCYPPAAAATVLEPLYPDRLAEDFLALTMPGHPVDYPAQPWAATTATTLLAGRGEKRTPPAYIPRAVTFIAAATERWPHVGHTCLYPLLRRDPQLALTAGSAALTTLADAQDVDIAVLEAIEPLLPVVRHVDLDVGAAAITVALTSHRLAVTTDTAERAHLYENLESRLSNAGRHDQAATAAEEMVDIWRQLAAADPATHLPSLADSLETLSGALTNTGRRGDALTAAEEAVKLRRQLAASDPWRQGDLATSLSILSSCFEDAERWTDASATAKEEVEIRRRLAGEAPTSQVYAHILISSLSAYSKILLNRGQHGDALPVIEEALEVLRRTSDDLPAFLEEDLADSLDSLFVDLVGIGRLEDAFSAAMRAVEIRRRLADADSAAHAPDLADSLYNLSVLLSRTDRNADALVATRQALEIHRRLAQANPGAYEPDLARSLDGLSNDLLAIGQDDEALAAAEEAIEIWQRLTQRNQPAYETDLADSLTNLTVVSTRLRRYAKALDAAEQEVDLRRKLQGGNSTVGQEIDLAASLVNLSTAMTHVHRRADALAATEEAVERWQRLVRNPMLPPTYLDSLRGIQALLMAALVEQGRSGMADEVRQFDLDDV